LESEEVSALLSSSELGAGDKLVLMLARFARVLRVFCCLSSFSKSFLSFFVLSSCLLSGDLSLRGGGEVAAGEVESEGWDMGGGVVTSFGVEDVSRGSDGPSSSL